MKINGLLRLFKGVKGFQGDRPTERQWQPTNTAHDPNPPITLENGGGGAVNYTLVCAVGAYVYTGQAATLGLARKLSLAVGAYVYTGQAATLTVARRLALDAGAYVYAGNNATLDYVPGRVDYILTCDVGAYVYTGQAASLTVARRLALDAGAYAYVGQDAVLDYVPGGVDYVLACDAGAYAYAGNDAVLTYVQNAPPAVVQPSGGGGGGLRYGGKRPKYWWEVDPEAIPESVILSDEIEEIQLEEQAVARKIDELVLERAAASTIRIMTAYAELLNEQLAAKMALVQGYEKAQETAFEEAQIAIKVAKQKKKTMLLLN